MHYQRCGSGFSDLPGSVSKVLYNKIWTKWCLTRKCPISYDFRPFISWFRPKYFYLWNMHEKIWGLGTGSHDSQPTRIRIHLPGCGSTALYVNGSIQKKDQIKKQSSNHNYNIRKHIFLTQHSKFISMLTVENITQDWRSEVMYILVFTLKRPTLIRCDR